MRTTLILARLDSALSAPIPYVHTPDQVEVFSIEYTSVSESFTSAIDELNQMAIQKKIHPTAPT
jgi:hypothetical protein